MFDGILKNMSTDMVRNLVLVFCSWLGVQPTSTQGQQMIAGALALLTVGWQWYENGGHQKIVDALKKSTGHATVNGAVNSAMSGTHYILVPFALLLLLGANDAKAQMVTKAPTVNAINYTNPFNGTPCTVAYCSGVTGGVDVGNGIMNGNLGYQYYDGVALVGAEVGVGAQVYSDANLVTNENGLFSYEIMKAGGSLSGLYGTTPQQPSVAPSLTANIISPYGFAGAVQRSAGGVIVGGWTIGAGVEYLISAHLFADAKVFQNEYSNTKLANETIVLAGVKMKF